MLICICMCAPIHRNIYTHRKIKGGGGDKTIITRWILEKKQMIRVVDLEHGSPSAAPVRWCGECIEKTEEQEEGPLGRSVPLCTPDHLSSHVTVQWPPSVIMVVPGDRRISWKFLAH